MRRVLLFLAPPLAAVFWLVFVFACDNGTTNIAIPIYEASVIEGGNAFQDTGADVSDSAFVFDVKFDTKSDAGPRDGSRDGVADTTPTDSPKPSDAGHDAGTAADAHPDAPQDAAHDGAG